MNINDLNQQQRAEALTAMVASAFTHHRELMRDASATPPTPAESKTAYLLDPIIYMLTDAVVRGAMQILGTQ